MEAILFVLLFGVLIGSTQPNWIPTSKNELDSRRLSTNTPVNPKLTTTVNHFRKQRNSETQKDQWDCKEGADDCFFVSILAKNQQEANKHCMLFSKLPDLEDEERRYGNLQRVNWYSLFCQNGTLRRFREYDNTPSLSCNFFLREENIVDIANGKKCFAVSNSNSNDSETRRISMELHNNNVRMLAFDCDGVFNYFCVIKQERLNETQRNPKPPSEAGNTLPNETVSKFVDLENKTRTSNNSADEVQSTALLFLKACAGRNVSEVDANRTAIIIDQVLRFTTETLIAAQKKSNASTCFLTGLEHVLTNSYLSNITLIASGFRGDVIDLTGSPSLLYTCRGLKGSANNTVIVRNPSAQPPNDEYDVSVTFNVTNLKMTRAKVSKVAFIYHPTLRLADAALAAKIQYADVYHINSSNADHEEVLAANYTAFSGMVQVGIRGGAVYNLSEPVNLYFRPLEPVNLSSPSISIICVFWNPKVNDGNGGWSTYGCWYQGIVKGLVHCRCNHFSAFTALYAYGQETTDTVHDKILDWLTRIGCALSLLGLVGVIGAYVIIPKCRVRRPGFYGHHLIFQQSLSLAALLITFLSGFDKAENSVNCMFVAALLHYFMLVVFFWMLMEAYYYYCLFVKVRGINTSSFMLKAGLFAWLVPCLTVVTLLSSEMDIYSYTNGTHCWLTTHGFYYALLPVVATITVINLFVYVLIIVKVGCRNSKLSSTQQPHRLSPHTAVAIFFLLGLSWSFGLLAIGEARTFFSYLFCIFNSLQGCVIFLLFFHRGRVAHQKTETL